MFLNVVFLSILAAAAAAASKDEFGFLDLKFQYNPESPLHISHALCSKMGFFPSYVTALIYNGTTLFPETINNTWPANEYTTWTRITQPTMMQAEKGNLADVQIFIWPQVDRTYDALRLETCSADTDGKLCRIDPNNPPSFFDATPIFRSNEFSTPNLTRLIVSKNRIHPDVIAADFDAISKSKCGDDSNAERCLPYFVYAEENQRCFIDCFPTNPEKRRLGQTCGIQNTIRPQCRLSVDSKLFFYPSSVASTSGQPKSINVTFADFTPIHITLQCKLPPALKVQPCPLSTSGTFCDPGIAVLRNGVAIYNSSENALQGAVPSGNAPMIEVFTDEQDETTTLLEVTVNFLSTIRLSDVADPVGMTGTYKFLINFDKVMLFDPHVDGLPEVNVIASTNIARQLAGFDLDSTDADDPKIGCRLTLDGQYDYRGHQNVDQCNQDRPCVLWADNIPQISYSSEFPEFGNSFIAKNYCRNPRHPGEKTYRPWCMLKRGSPTDWAYCDVPFCGDLETPLGYERINGDCTCLSNEDTFGPETNDITVCMDRCSASASCSGFVFDEAGGKCKFKSARCQCGVGLICSAQEAKTYYRRTIRDAEIHHYLAGSDEILFQVHTVETRMETYRIRCSLYWRPDQNAQQFSWEFYDRGSDKFIPASESDESTWFRDPDRARFYLDLKISAYPDNFNNRLYRCQYRSMNYEYHLVKTFNLPECTVFFNQILDYSFKFKDYGFNLAVYRDVKENTTDEFPLQWDLDCKIDRRLVGHNQMDGSLSVPIVIIYQNFLQLGSNLFNSKAFKMQIDVPEKPSGNASDPYKFHLGLHFENFNATQPLQNMISHVYSLLFYYPQLEKSHNGQMLSKVTSIYNYTKNHYNTMPTFPVVSTGWPIPKSVMYMSCSIVYDNGDIQLAATEFRLALKVPSPFRVDFRCTTKANARKRGKFCYQTVTNLCYPVRLALRRNGNIVYRGDWQKPDVDVGGPRIDSNATFPVFRYLSAEHETTLILRMTTNFDPFYLFDIAKREQLLIGRYELGFFLDTDTVRQEFIKTLVTLDIVVSEPTGVSKNTGDCRPAITPTNDGWFSTGSTSTGFCDEKKCFPWTTDLLKQSLATFKGDWVAKDQDIVQYQFVATESSNYCRNPSDSSRFGMPFCAIGFNNDKTAVEWRYCDIPFCEDALLADHRYIRKLGQCNCDSGTTPSTIQIDGKDWYKPPENSTLPYPLQCRAMCDNTKGCVAFNLAESGRSCEFKSCQCTDSFRLPMPSGACHSNVLNPAHFHYYERVNLDDAVVRKRRLVGSGDVVKDISKVIKAEIYVHLIDAFSKNVLISCDLPDLGSKEKTVANSRTAKWDTPDRVKVEEVNIGDKWLVRVTEEISFEKHDNSIFVCTNKSDQNHFRAHLIRVLTPPTCSVSIAYSNGTIVTNDVNATGYSFRFVDIANIKEAMDHDGSLEATPLFDCKIPKMRLGYCENQKDIPCSPYFKIFFGADPVYRSYDEKFVKGDSGMQAPEVKMNLDNDPVQLAISVKFKPAADFEQTSVAFYFAPYRVIHPEETQFGNLPDPGQYSRAVKTHRCSSVEAIYLLVIVAVISYLRLAIKN